MIKARRGLLVTLALLMGLLVVAGVSACEKEPAVYQSVSAGTWHTCGLLEDGSVRCWGAGQQKEDRFFYSMHPLPEGPFRSVSLNAYHGCGVL